MNRDYWVASADVPAWRKEKPLPEVDLHEMLIASQRFSSGLKTLPVTELSSETLSTRERMSAILDRVHQAGEEFVEFSELFDFEEGRSGVVVTFLAIMELIKESLLEIVQTEAFAPIHVKARMPSEQVIEIDESDFQAPIRS